MSDFFNSGYFFDLGNYVKRRGSDGFINGKDHFVNVSKVSRVPQVPRVPQAYAHEEELEASSSAESDAASPASNEASPSAKLTDSVWKSKDCLDLKKELSDFANGEGLSKLIVIPRPNMDTTIALTAWGRIDTIDRIDKDRMSAFIKVFRNNGPEKTME